MKSEGVYSSVQAVVQQYVKCDVWSDSMCKWYDRELR